MEKEKRFEEVARNVYWVAQCKTCGWQSKFFENKTAALCAEWQHINQYELYGGTVHEVVLHKLINIIIENHGSGGDSQTRNDNDDG